MSRSSTDASGDCKKASMEDEYATPADTADANEATAASRLKVALQNFAYTPSPPLGSSSNALTPKRIIRSSLHAASQTAASPVAKVVPSKSSPLKSAREISTSSSKRAPPKRSASSTASPQPSPKKKRSSGYAPPSRYAHIPNLLTDALAPNLICVFIGVNPGLKTATTGHAYAHPSNLFWKLLHSSGCTPRRCLPSETHDLPQLYGLGSTNIVARATANAAELSREEMDAGVAVLETKIRECRPLAVAIVGKGIWESIWRVRHGKAIGKDQFRYGWQDEGENMGKLERSEGAGDGEWKGAKVFVATSTSGLAAGLRPPEKEAVWRPLGEFVQEERLARGLVGNRRFVDGDVVQGE